jgi:hypothetical protein
MNANVAQVITAVTAQYQSEPRTVMACTLSTMSDEPLSWNETYNIDMFAVLRIGCLVLAQNHSAEYPQRLTVDLQSLVTHFDRIREML